MSVAELPRNYDGEPTLVPPQDLVAEQSVLGAMLLSKDAIADVIEVLREQDFYKPAHRSIFDAIRSLSIAGEPVDPVKSTAYYRPGLGVDPTSVQAYPAGLQMVAGSAGATSPQPVSKVAWSCGVGIAREATPPACPEGRDLRLIVTFPDCWDGVHLDSDDHHAHVAYSSGGACPPAWPSRSCWGRAIGRTICAAACARLRLR